MKIGVVYPQTEYGSDVGAIKDYALVAEDLGYSHILAYDHVVGANPPSPKQWKGPYTYRHPFQEPLMLFSFMAGITKKIEFTTGIIILPQRQTALVAKQAATLDVLSGGRLRFGVGIGWNAVEYQALSQDFHTRGKRVEEQIELLRNLWTTPLVKFQGQWDAIPDAGINPLPVQRPIPIWFGGHAEAVLRRVGTMGDGWMPNYRTAADAEPSLKVIKQYAESASRNIRDIGLEARIMYGSGDQEKWAKRISEWKKVGASHISINTMGAGFSTPDQHLQALRTFSEAISK
jgi:probable F420-dependent oxidoreductase